MIEQDAAGDGIATLRIRTFWKLSFLMIMYSLLDISFEDNPEMKSMLPRMHSKTINYIKANQSEAVLHYAWYKIGTTSMIYLQYCKLNQFSIR